MNQEQLAQVAGGGRPFTDLEGALNYAAIWINRIIVFIIGLAVLFFIIGVFKFVKNAGEPADQKKAKQFMFWGIIGIFVMLSVWGLIGILQNTFGTAGQQGDVERLIPQIPGFR